VGIHGSETCLECNRTLITSGSLSKLAIELNMCAMSNLRCTWISLLSEEILNCNRQVSLEYGSRAWEYDTSTRYRLDCLSIPGWLEIYCAGSVEGKSKNWQRFSFAIDCKWFSIVDSVNILNSFAIVITCRGSDTPENSNPICWCRYHIST